LGNYFSPLLKIFTTPKRFYLIKKKQNLRHGPSKWKAYIDSDTFLLK
jgi:hypothetical protein